MNKEKQPDNQTNIRFEAAKTAFYKQKDADKKVKSRAFSIFQDPSQATGDQNADWLKAERFAVEEFQTKTDEKRTKQAKIWVASTLVILAALAGSIGIANSEKNKPTNTPATPTTTASGQDAPKPAAKVQIKENKPEPTLKAEPKREINTQALAVLGVPKSVDRANVDIAKGMFVNTIGLGTEIAVAEPGGLLVGPDFGSKSANNPYGENSQGWDAMYKSGGAIQPFSPETQQILEKKGPSSINVAENGLAMVSLGEGRLEVDGIELNLPHKEYNNYIVLIKGLFGDMQQNTDRNRTMKISGYVAGHTLVNRLAPKGKTNIAFWSEGQILQMIQTAHSEGTNCGDGGCSKVILVVLDLNTKAFTIIEQNQGRFENTKDGWRLVATNLSGVK